MSLFNLSALEDACDEVQTPRSYHSAQSTQKTEEAFGTMPSEVHLLIAEHLPTYQDVRCLE